MKSPQKFGKSIWKISSLLISCALIFNSFFSVASYAMEELSVDNQIEEDSLVSTENPKQADYTVKESESNTEKTDEFLMESDKEDIENISDGTWIEKADSSFITRENLRINREYIIEKFDNLKIVFNDLPDNPGRLKVEEVYAPELIDHEEVISKAYNISSDMQNQSFSYDLYLPRPNGATSSNMNVKYSEDGTDYTDIAIDNVDSSYIILKNLNHFTVFVITDDDASYTGDPWTEQQDRGSNEDPTWDIHYPSFPEEDERATWDFSGVTPGNYFIYVSWTTNDNRTEDATYTLEYNGGTYIFSVNQELLADGSAGTNGQWSGWYAASTDSFAINTSSYIYIETKENSSGTEYIIVDDVLLVEDIPPTVDPLTTNDTTPPLSGTISVDDPLAVITVNVDGTDYFATNNGDGTWDIADNIIAILAEGSYDVAVSYTDMAGRLRSDETTDELTIDLTAPVVEITEPSHTDIVSGIVDVMGSVTDPNPDHYYLVVRRMDESYVAGPRTVYRYNSFTNELLFAWDTTAVADGDYIIHLAARDAAGNRDDSAGSLHRIIVTVDNTAPEAPLFWVEEDTDEVKIDWNSSVSVDTTGYIVYRSDDGGTTYNIAANVGNVLTYTDSTISTNSDYYYKVTAYDSAGNESDVDSVEEKYAGSMEIVIDDDASESDFNNSGSTSSSGSWTRWGMPGSSAPSQNEVLKGATGGDSHGSGLSATGQTYTWTTNRDDLYGMYEVYVQYLCNPPRGIAEYTVNGNSPVSVDQSLMADQVTACGSQFSSNTESHWVSIGVYPMYNETLEVTLTARIDERGILADAVGIRWVSEIDTTPSVTITPSSATISEGETVALIATGTGGNNPLSYSWSCTNGQIGTGPNITFTEDTDGSYSCTVTVTDSDGDTATDTSTITVNDPPSSPSRTQEEREETVANTDTSGESEYTFAEGEGTSTANSTNQEDDYDEKNESDENGEILGEETCEVMSKISGYIYYDENGNGEKDENEEGLEGIEVNIYTQEDGEEQKVTDTKTDSNGYWEAEICPGEYRVNINQDNLPEKTKIKGSDSLSITVSEKEDLSGVDFTLESESSFFDDFNALWCLLPLIIIALIAIGNSILKQRRQNASLRMY